MAGNSLQGIEKRKIVNIPKVAFKAFIRIADGNLVNGSPAQTLCYLLGPKQKNTNDEIWIDTVVIPEQSSLLMSVEDDGIGETDSISYLRELSITKNKEVFAWVHSRSPGENKCEFTSTDVHTQYVLEKYVSKDILGIIIEIRKHNYVWNAMNLNIFGKQRAEFCGKNFNTPFEPHKWCACDCLYESCKSNIEFWDDIPYGKKKVLIADFLNEKELGKPRWVLAEEPPSDSESDIENPEDEVLCENCDKKLLQSSLLKHISHSEECKSFYGPRFEEMKQKKTRNKKRKSRQKLGIQQELKKQKESYQIKVEKQQLDRKTRSIQQSSLLRADRENILHWKLAIDYLRISANIRNTVKAETIREIGSSIENLYEKFRLEIRRLFQENHESFGKFNEENILSFNDLTLNIPEPGESRCIREDHKARLKRIGNKICSEWYNLKLKIDLKIGKDLNIGSNEKDMCFCCQKDLSSDDIYGPYNGWPWLCQDEKKFVASPLNTEEILKKLQKPSSSKNST